MMPVWKMKTKVQVILFINRKTAGTHMPCPRRIWTVLQEGPTTGYKDPAT